MVCPCLSYQVVSLVIFGRILVQHIIPFHLRQYTFCHSVWPWTQTVRHWWSGTCQIPDLQQWLKDGSLMQQLLQQHLLKAQKQIKAQADKKRSDREFVIGDSVYLKIQPYVQSSLASRSSNKLSFRYFGPYTITAKIGPAAYKLKLPEGCTIHLSSTSHFWREQFTPPSQWVLNYLTFHMSCRYPNLSWTNASTKEQQDDAVGVSSMVSLATWTINLGRWVPLRYQFPRVPASGQAGSKGGGDVTVPAPARRMPMEIDGGAGLRTCERKKKDNMRVTGPDWVK